jgi:metal-responsive CopG/Arc/MetJ family transcriptional regulator
MKTAISIPDAVFKAADRLARRRGVSRSELYTRALQTLLQADGDEQITAKLNEVYADAGSALPAELRRLPARVLDREEW